MSKQELSLEEQLYRIGLIFLVVGSILLFLYMKVLLPHMPSMPCQLYEILGIYCPGCGGTRAVEALLKGKLLTSLWYHPVVGYTLVVYGGYMLTHTLEKLRVWHIKGWKFHDWYLYVALIIVVANCVLRNVLLLAFGITL